MAVSGPDGSGKTTLVREATQGLPVILHRCPPMPDPSQRSALAETLRATLSALGRRTPDPEEDPSDWTTLLDWVAQATDSIGPPLVLVLDDAHRLSEARSRLDPAVQAALSGSRQAGRPWHIVLVGRPGSLPRARQADGSSPVELHIGPLPFRAAQPLLPGASPADRLEAYAVFGGNPGSLRHVDSAASLTTNIRRLLLNPSGPLADAGIAPLERQLQTPSRYSAILGALALGEAEWAAVHEGVTDLTSSGQVAPYLKRLEELALVETRRSLDSKPRSRSRRYRITDPLLAFWYRLARLTHWRMEGEDALAAPLLRTAIRDQAAAVFAEVCRQFMAHDVMEILGHNARETGSLWGSRYELDVAGILKSGAVFYGSCHWSEAPSPRNLRSLDAGIRETRYGFGREARLRMLFMREPASADLARAAARRHDVKLITVQEVAGTG